MEYFIKLFQDTPFPGGMEFTEEANAFFRYGNDLVYAYRGDSNLLMQASKAYFATENRAYAHAGAASVLGSASYIGGGKYYKKGLQEAFHLIQNAKNFAPDMYEIELIEVSLYRAADDMDMFEYTLKNLARLPESNTESSFAWMQMRYWMKRKDMKLVRHWFEVASKRAEHENDVRRMGIFFTMADALANIKEYTDEAIALYRKVTQLNPGDPWAWHNMSLLYMDKKDYEKAGECNRKALDLMNFKNAEGVMQDLIKIWEKARHKDPLREYPRFLSSATQSKKSNWLIGKK